MAEGKGGFKLATQIAVTALVAGGAYVLVLRPLLCRSGLVTCKIYTKRLKAIKKYKGFNPTWYMTNPSKANISSTRAKVLADKFRDAAGYINDDEDAFYSVLIEAGNSYNLSKISEAYSARYNGANMADWITYYMNDFSEIKEIHKTLIKYPY